VRLTWTDSFAGDWRRLTDDERARFRAVVLEDFHPVCERRRADPSAAWSAKLRVRAVQRAAGIWEMTWSFAGPDGRATFEWVTIDGEPGIRWRRIGGHAIFGAP
jgi:putative SOS response-associated peptidase YedK